MADITRPCKRAEVGLWSKHGYKSCQSQAEKICGSCLGAWSNVARIDCMAGFCELEDVSDAEATAVPSFSAVPCCHFFRSV